MPTYTGTTATSTTTVPYYQTITYADLLQRISHTGGVEVERLLSADSTALRDYINSAMREGWEYYKWPHLMRSTSLTAGNLSNYAEYDIMGIYSEDPRDKRYPNAYTWSIDANGPFLLTDVDDTTTIYIRYRDLFYPFSGTAYAAGTYSKDQMVYDSTTGDYYRSVADSNTSSDLTDTAWWDRREIPAFLVEWTRYKTLADWREAEGQPEKAVSLEQKAWMKLALDIEKFERQKNLQQRPIVRVRSGGAT